MRPNRRMIGALVAASIAAASPGAAQQGCTEDAMIVFDGSGSMAEMGYNGLDRPRIFDAREAMHSAVPRVAPVRRIGLVVYGPGAGDACSNVVLHLRPKPDAAPDILGVIDALDPDGNTALTRAVREAAETLEYQTKPGVIVLVTDGKETCGGTPCQLAGELVRDAAALTVHVIGFKVRAAHFDWSQGTEGPKPAPSTSVARCLADQTGGQYVSAESVEDLVRALQQTLGCPIYSALDVTRIRRP